MRQLIKTAKPDRSQRQPISRRELLRLALGAGAFVLTGGVAMAASIIQRPIPRTGE